MVDKERLGEERSGVIASIFWDSWTGIAAATDLENGLQLRAIGVRMASSEHLHDETSE